MNDKEIHELVQNIINKNKIIQLDESICFNNSREEYVFNTAQRLLKIWFKLLDNQIYKVDFECSLRNYLMIVKMYIYISN